MAKLVEDDTPVIEKVRAKLVPIDENEADKAIDHPAFAKAGLYEKPSITDYIKHYIGRYIPSTLSNAGGMIGGMAGAEGGPATMIGGAGLGAAGGSAIGSALKGIAPSIFGEPTPGTFGPTAQMGQDALIDGIIPEVAGQGISRGFKGLTSSILSSRLVSKFSPTINAAREGERITDIGTKASEFLKPPDTLPESTFVGKPVRTASPEFTPGYNQELLKGHEQLTNLVNKGYSPSSGRFDAAKVFDELSKNGKEYGNIDPITKNNFKEFLTEAINQKPFIDPANPPLLRYSGKRLLLGLGSSMGLGLLGHPGYATGSAAASSIILGEAGIKQLMKNPEIAKLTLQSLKTGSQAPESTFLSKAVLMGLRGTNVVLETPDDKPLSARVNEKGELEYVRPGVQ